MDYKFCPECGTKLAKNTRFCPNCGTKQPDIDLQDDDHSTKNDLFEENKQFSNSKKQLSDNKQEGSKQQPDFSQYNFGSHKNSQQQVNQQSYQNSQQQQQFNRQAYQNSQQQYQNHDNDWRPYNQSEHPSLTNSFNLWMRAWNNANGCMGRADFWWGYLATGIIMTLLYCCVLLFTSIVADTPNLTTIGIIIYIIYLIISIPYAVLLLIVIMERLHDTGHSGWNILWYLTGIGAFYVIYLLCLPTNWDQTQWVRKNG